MKTISGSNPFGYNRYGYLWERLRDDAPGRHLDYGAFDGAILAQLVESAAVTSAVGVDCNAAVVARCRDSLPHGATLLAIRPSEQLPFPDASFDSASLLDVIEHVIDQRQILCEIRRVLRPGGLLVVTAPKQHLFSILDTGNFKFVFPSLHRWMYSAVQGRSAYHSRYVECANGLFGDIEVGKHRHEHFSPAHLEDVLSRAGFKMVDVDGAGLFARILVPLRFVGRSPMRRLTDRLMAADARRFSSTHLFCRLASRSPS